MYLLQIMQPRLVISYALKLLVVNEILGKLGSGYAMQPPY